MVLLQILEIIDVFGDYLRVEYLCHAFIMPSTKQNVITHQFAQKSPRTVFGASASSSASRPATPLSGGPPHREHRQPWPPGAPCGGRRGFGRVLSLLRGARARSAAPIAGTQPSAYSSLVLVRRTWKYSTSCTAPSPLFTQRRGRVVLRTSPVYGVLGRSQRLAAHRQSQR